MNLSRLVIKLYSNRDQFKRCRRHRRCSLNKCLLSQLQIITMKRTNLTNFYQKFHRHRKQKNLEKQNPPPPPPMEHDLDDLLEYDDEFCARITHSSSLLDLEEMNNQPNDGVPLSVELAAATSSPDAQEIFLRLPCGSGKVVEEDRVRRNVVAKPSDLEYDDELDLESIYENSSKAATPATSTVPQSDDEQILFEGEIYELTFHIEFLIFWRER